MRRELFLAFFPIQQIKTVLFLQFILVTEITMQRRTIYLRNWQGKIVSTSSFPEEEYQQGSLQEEPSLVMYEFLRYLMRKQCRYPFQLLKQFVLFSDEESSIEVGYKHMRYELEIIEVNIEAVCDLFRQKLLVHGFITIKHAYEKRLRLDQAYYNQQNLQQIHETMLLISQARKSWLKWQVFGQLYQNFKGFKLSKISLSKIEINHNDLTSKELQQFQPFLNPKQPEIEQIHSFIIEKAPEQQPEPYVDQIQSQRQKYGQYEGLKIEKRSSYKEYEYKGDRLTSERSMVKHTPTNNNTKLDIERQTDQFEHKVLVTHKKQGDLIEAGSTQRGGKHTAESQPQYIYLIRDSVKKKGPPSNYIKIPLTTENVKIVEIQTERKKKKKRQVIQQRVSMSEKQCVNCKFCEMSQERRQIMSRLKERIEIQVRNTNIQTEYIRDNHSRFDKNIQHRHSQHYQAASKHRDFGISQFRYEFHGNNGLNLGLQQYQKQKQHGVTISQRIERGQRSTGNALALSFNNDGHSHSHSSSHCQHNTSYGDGYTLSKGYSYHKTTQFCTK